MRSIIKEIPLYSQQILTQILLANRLHASLLLAAILLRKRNEI